MRNKSGFASYYTLVFFVDQGSYHADMGGNASFDIYFSFWCQKEGHYYLDSEACLNERRFYDNEYYSLLDIPMRWMDVN